MTDREKIEAIVRKRFQEMPDEEACQFRKEDYELPDDPEIVLEDGKIISGPRKGQYIHTELPNYDLK